MKMLNISISEVEFKKLGLRKEKLSFTEFVELVSQTLSRQTLNKSIELAEKYGLSKLTMSEITREVKTVRKSAKSRN